MDHIRNLIASEPLVARAVVAVIVAVVSQVTGLIELGTNELLILLGLEGAVTWRQRAHVTPVQ